MNARLFLEATRNNFIASGEGHRIVLIQMLENVLAATNRSATLSKEQQDHLLSTILECERNHSGDSLMIPATAIATWVNTCQ